MGAGLRLENGAGCRDQLRHAGGVGRGDVPARHRQIFGRRRDHNPAVAAFLAKTERAAVGRARLEGNAIAAVGRVERRLQVSIGGHMDRAARRADLGDVHLHSRKFGHAARLFRMRRGGRSFRWALGDREPDARQDEHHAKDWNELEQIHQGHMGVALIGRAFEARAARRSSSGGWFGPTADVLDRAGTSRPRARIPGREAV